MFSKRPGVDAQNTPDHPADDKRPLPMAGTPDAPEDAFPTDGFKEPPEDERPRRARGRSTPYFAAAFAATSTARLVVAVLVLLILAGLFSFLAAFFNSSSYNNAVWDDTFAVIGISGTIQNTGAGSFGMNEGSYQYAETLAYIKKLAESEGNRGILLKMNTPGGGVYESEEVYTALMDYKEQTGRPIWAYMANSCASGGYYICAAADRLIANVNTSTGSIGVYISLTDSSELYEKLGVETVLIRSGDNKGIGISGTAITEGQRAVYQSIVDENYARFTEVVAKGRGMPMETVLELSDGRPYTGRQALALGLVDELGDWDSALAAFEEDTGYAPSYPNFSRKTPLGSLLGNLRAMLPKDETTALLEVADNARQGVPMALYQP